MCGIAGIFAFGGRKVAPAAIQALTRAIVHRGPDGEGKWFSRDRSIALGHRRLAVLDPSPAGAQPMSSHDERYVIVYNGEIYNFLEIARELKALGCRVDTASDTEVILLAYQVWGEDMLRRFNGMWALAIVDTERQSVFLSRDRFGVKPLYFYQDNECFVFASEVGAIQALIPDRVEPDQQFLGRLASFDFAPFGDGQTHLAQVKAVPAGFNLRVSDGQSKMGRWYSLPSAAVARRFSGQVTQFRELLVDACRLRLRSDVPVATCLSGGMDSSSIVSLLGREQGDCGIRADNFTHRSFTAAFPGTELDESADACLVAQAAGMEFDRCVITPPDAAELERAMAACDGPMPSLSFFPIWKLYRHIKDAGISVTIDGQGADEMMGGYYLGYPALRGAWQSRNIPWMVDVARTYSMLHPDGGEWIRNDWNQWRRVTRSESDQALKLPLKKVLSKLSLYDRRRLEDQAAPPVWQTGAVHPGTRNELASALRRQFFGTPLPFLLHQYDRASMASGVECRMPFMDYRLVEFVFSLPLTALVGGGYTKRILRHSMRGLMPETIRTNRRKTGFNAPYTQWFDSGLREWLLDQVNDHSFASSDLFDGKGIQESVLSGSARTDERSIWPAVHTAWWAAQSKSLTRRVTPLFAT